MSWGQWFLLKQITGVWRNSMKVQALREKQSWPLDRKIEESLELIRCWHEAFDGWVYVAFSGGKDSTVLLHLVRSIYPDVMGVFVNTGLEFPEIVAFVKKHLGPEIIRPEMTFNKVIEKWGYPVISKKVSQHVHEVKNAKGYTATKRLRLTGIKSNGEFTRLGMIPPTWKFLCNSPFKISDRCCYELKKKPFAKIQLKFGMPLSGMMASDSKVRERLFQGGCNQYEIKKPMSNPIAFWMQQDVWNYLKINRVPYSSIYNKGYDRTGCIFCMFGVHMEQKKRGTNRFILGVGEVLDFIGVPYEDKQLKLFN